MTRVQFALFQKSTCYKDTEGLSLMTQKKSRVEYPKKRKKTMLC